MKIQQTSVQLIFNGKTPIGLMTNIDGHVVIFKLSEASETEAVEILSDSKE